MDAISYPIRPAAIHRGESGRAYHDLVQEVLDELLLEGPRGEEAV